MQSISIHSGPGTLAPITANAVSRIDANGSTQLKGGNIMNDVLSPARLKQLSAMQGTRGVIGGLVSKACLLTNGTYYVDVVAEAPALVDATTRNGDAKYADDDGNFSLNKLHNDVSSNVTRKHDKAVVDGNTFPNVEAIRDDDAGTVYIVNWDLAPVEIPAATDNSDTSVVAPHDELNDDDDDA